MNSDLPTDPEWKVFTLGKELEETRKALALLRAEVKAVIGARYWTVRGYRKNLKKIRIKDGTE